ncbi:hypothetical protein [Paenibacillus sp. CF384]|uniref:hypothetical protein n=1 Tax=Paenibacillus sp. CF384 TaxID=1884382 RepID=UPI000B85F7D0|nr:hypothetical protein [Paenibacillus sp. CF384]
MLQKVQHLERQSSCEEQNVARNATILLAKGAIGGNGYEMLQKEQHLLKTSLFAWRMLHEM